jgi:hypothetical protein
LIHPDAAGVGNVRGDFLIVRRNVRRRVHVAVFVGQANPPDPIVAEEPENLPMRLGGYTFVI